MRWVIWPEDTRSYYTGEICQSRIIFVLQSLELRYKHDKVIKTKLSYTYYKLHIAASEGNLFIGRSFSSHVSRNASQLHYCIHTCVHNFSDRFHKHHTCVKWLYINLGSIHNQILTFTLSFPPFCRMLNIKLYWYACIHTHINNTYTHIYAHESDNGDEGFMPQKHPQRPTPLSGADPGGGARGPPPPHFLGKKTRGPKTTHTEKKRSKSDKNEARYRLKRTPKHTKYAQILRWGGLRGHKGKYFVHKSNKE